VLRGLAGVAGVLCASFYGFAGAAGPRGPACLLLHVRLVWLVVSTDRYSVLGRTALLFKDPLALKLLEFNDYWYI
jgi:hypothetical protein